MCKWISADDLLALVRAAGFQLTRSQLARRHRAGLLATPRRVGAGRGHGTRTEYPSGTAEQILALLELERSERRFAELAWSLWWRGFSISEERVRTSLVATAQDWDAAVAELRRLKGEAMLSEGFLDELDRYTTSRLGPGPVRRVRRRVGRTALSSVVRMLLDAATGEFQDPFGAMTDLERDEEERLLEKALGLTKARTDRIAGEAPWLQGSLLASLATLSHHVAVRPLSDEAATATDRSLLEARNEISRFAEVIQRVGAALVAAHGPHAAGLGVAATEIGDLSGNDQRVLLLAWLRLRREPTLLEGLRAIISAADEVGI
jgi:hypothetical protein